MRKIRLLFLIPALITLLYSCQKEVNLQNQQNPGSGGTATSIIGDYDFVGLTAHTQTTVTVASAGGQLKSITVSDYETKNNKGTVKFTSNTFSYTDIAYSIDTVLNSKTYLDNVLLDDTDLPFVADLPPTSASTNYVRNNNDSLTFPNPVLSVSSGFSGGGPTGPMGARISWHGTILSLRMVSSFTNNVSQGGVPGKLDGVFDVTILFKKK